MAAHFKAPQKAAWTPSIVIPLVRGGPWSRLGPILRSFVFMGPVSFPLPVGVDKEVALLSMTHPSSLRRRVPVGFLPRLHAPSRRRASSFFPGARARLAAGTVPPIAFKERTLANRPEGLFLGRPDYAQRVGAGLVRRRARRTIPPAAQASRTCFEHMMFKATRNTPSETIRPHDRGCGRASTTPPPPTTSPTTTRSFRPITWSACSWAESQRLGSLVVDEAVFKSERDVVKEELRQSVLSQPYGQLFYLYLPQAGLHDSPLQALPASARSRSWTRRPWTTCAPSTPPTTGRTTPP